MSCRSTDVNTTNHPWHGPDSSQHPCSHSPGHGDVNHSRALHSSQEQIVRRWHHLLPELYFLSACPCNSWTLYRRRLFWARRNSRKDSGWSFETFSCYCPQNKDCEHVKLLNTGWPLQASGLMFLLWQSLMGRQEKYSQVTCFLPCHWRVSVA